MNNSAPQGNIVLLSGGLDSLAVLALSISSGAPTTALFCNYGQRAAERERHAAVGQCRHYGVPLVELALGFRLDDAGGLFEGVVPTGRPLDGRDAEDTARAVWVPARNAVLVALAGSVAERHGLAKVLIGCNAEEGRTFPDNSAGFVQAADSFLSLGTMSGVKVEAPLIEMDKAAIIATLVSLDAPFHLVWSCYLSGDLMCGECESCLRLKRALSSVPAASGILKFVR